MLQQALEELALRNVSPDWLPVPYIPAFAAALAALAACAALRSWLRENSASSLPSPPPAASAKERPAAPPGFGREAPPQNRKLWERPGPAGAAPAPPRPGVDPVE